MKYNELEQCYECETCGQLISESTMLRGKKEGWAYCPACGSECQKDYDNIKE